MTYLDDIDFKIYEALARLDDFARGYEARWGVGRLELLVDKELSDKFERQYRALSDAVLDKDMARIYELIEGCKRGWRALEAAVLAAGYKLESSDYMEARIEATGEVLRVYKTLVDARAPRPDGVVSMSLGEVAALVGRERKRVYFDKPIRAHTADEAAARANAFDWKNGDKIGF